ncbi:MAG: lysophospholipid acyltransferase family protein [Gemmatimonadetes bacterium]|nr:lysophospholipid acyltransferase family protein [Gemmatimonadota bacterium]
MSTDRKRNLIFETAGVLGTGLVAALFMTTRVERIGAENYRHFRREGKQVIFVFWHGQLLPLVHYHRREGIVVLVSEHADGEYITRVIERNGFGTVRGSSRRGATKGLKGLVRAAEGRTRPCPLTPDGPRGPVGVFKPGALAAAQLTGLPIIPLAVGASSGWRFRSWDGFLVPKPLSRIRLEYLPPRFVPRDAGRAELVRMSTEIGQDLNALTARLNAEGVVPPGESWKGESWPRESCPEE